EGRIPSPPRWPPPPCLVAPMRRVTSPRRRRIDWRRMPSDIQVMKMWIGRLVVVFGLVSLLLGVAGAGAPALADGRGHSHVRGHGHGSHFHGRVFIGPPVFVGPRFYVGAPYYPYPYGPYYYRYPPPPGGGPPPPPPHI